MISYDGPTLRSVRENLGVPLRRIARRAGMSHGHLSKVERGEHGRPVTPAVINAYEQVTGVSLSGAIAKVPDRGGGPAARRPPGKTWRVGQLSDVRRRALTAAFGALSTGGYLGEPVRRLVESTGRPSTPVCPELLDAAQLDLLSAEVTALDLRFGGGLVSQASKAVLRWAVPMLDAIGVDDPAGRRVYAAVAGLARRSAWSAFDTLAHEAARGLFRLASYAAVQCGDRDLRAHVLADVAAQYSYTGYHEDGLEIIRIVEGDERVCPAVRMGGIRCEGQDLRGAGGIRRVSAAGGGGRGRLLRGQSAGPAGLAGVAWPTRLSCTRLPGMR